VHLPPTAVSFPAADGRETLKPTAAIIYQTQGRGLNPAAFVLWAASIV
jgi:hypothetical protein